MKGSPVPSVCRKMLTISSAWVLSLRICTSSSKSRPSSIAGDVAEDLLRDRVDLTKTEVGVHEIDAELRLIE